MTGTKHTTSKSIGKFDTKMYFKEIESDFLNKNSPGPAAYENINMNTLSNFRVSFNGSFPREKRNLDSSLEEDGPSPQTYAAHEAFQRMESVKVATIGRYKRSLDLRMAPTI